MGSGGEAVRLFFQVDGPSETSPSPAEGEGDGPDEGDDIPDDLSPDDVEEVSEYDATQIEAEEATEEWIAEVANPSARQMVIDTYLHSGDLDEAVQALGPDHAVRYAEAAQKVEAAVSARIGKEIADSGLTFDEMMEHMAEEDYGHYRQEALKGNWQAFRDLAKAGMELRLRLAREAGHF